MNTQKKIRLSIQGVVAITLLSFATVAGAQSKKPNILVIMGDDIGWFNISCYNRASWAIKTPNIDRIGKEGAMFHRLVWRNRVAPPDARPSSPGNRRSAQA